MVERSDVKHQNGILSNTKIKPSLAKCIRFAMIGAGCSHGGVYEAVSVVVVLVRFATESEVVQSTESLVVFRQVFLRVLQLV